MLHQLLKLSAIVTWCQIPLNIFQWVRNIFIGLLSTIFLEKYFESNLCFISWDYLWGNSNPLCQQLDWRQPPYYYTIIIIFILWYYISLDCTPRDYHQPNHKPNGRVWYAHRAAKVCLWHSISYKQSGTLIMTVIFTYTYSIWVHLVAWKIPIKAFCPPVSTLFNYILCRETLPHSLYFQIHHCYIKL